MNDPGAQCRRCGASLTGPYCAECGQHRTQPIDLLRLAGDLLGKLTEFDLGIGRTIRDLSLRPSWMIREYLEGNRGTWTNPGKYLFWMATAYALVLTFWVDPETLNIRMLGETVGRQQLLLAMGAIAYLGFLYLLLTALATSWLLRPAIRSVGEAYVALLYLYGHGLLVLGMLALAGWWSPLITRAVFLVYMTWGLVGLLEGARWRRLLKGLIVYAIYLLTSILVIGGYFYAYQRFFGGGGPNG